MAEDGDRKVDAMISLHLGEQGAEVVQFLGAEVNPFAAGAAMATQVYQDTAPALLGEEESPGKHGKTGISVTMEKNNGAARRDVGRGGRLIRSCRLGDLGSELEIECAANFVDVIGPAEVVFAWLNDSVADAGWW